MLPTLDNFFYISLKNKTNKVIKILCYVNVGTPVSEISAWNNVISSLRLQIYHFIRNLLSVGVNRLLALAKKASTYYFITIMRIIRHFIFYRRNFVAQNIIIQLCWKWSILKRNSLTLGVMLDKYLNLFKFSSLKKFAAMKTLLYSEFISWFYKQCFKEITVYVYVVVIEILSF